MYPTNLRNVTNIINKNLKNRKIHFRKNCVDLPTQIEIFIQIQRCFMS